MSLTDELAKLDELRKKGALTPAEFETQKKALLRRTQKRKIPWIVRIPLALAGLVIAYLSLSDLSDANSVPPCDSAGARAALKNAFERNATANAITLQLLDLQNTREVSFNEAGKERRCTATALLNAGRRDISYRLWRTQNKTLLVEVN